MLAAVPVASGFATVVSGTHLSAARRRVADTLKLLPDAAEFGADEWRGLMAGIALDIAHPGRE